MNTNKIRQTIAAWKQNKSGIFWKPRRYSIVMHNDDITPMSFVVYILEEIFHKPTREAYRLMLSVHHGGSIVIGRYYVREIARRRQEAATEIARGEGFPFYLELRED